MAYRDRSPACPRCGLALMRRQRRDIWRCPQCGGMQLAAGELERRLRVLAPDIDDDVIRDVMTARRPRAVRRRARAEPMICATCHRPMVQVAMGGASVARCDTDDQLWFDAAELERIVELVGARHQSQRSWLARLFAHLFAS